MVSLKIAIVASAALRFCAAFTAACCFAGTGRPLPDPNSPTPVLLSEVRIDAVRFGCSNRCGVEHRDASQPGILARFSR